MAEYKGPLKKNICLPSSTETLYTIKLAQLAAAFNLTINIDVFLISVHICL